jgi:hypothetical protein
MKIIKRAFLIMVCFLFFSCWAEENPGRFSYYTKSFFINENSFTFEGETFNNYTPYLKELRYLSKTEYDYYGCHYLYVAEPIDLSETIIIEGESELGYIIDTHNYGFGLIMGISLVF